MMMTAATATATAAATATPPATAATAAARARRAAARWALGGLLALVGLAACGGVRPVDVHDERLPLEARRWVGGAEDAVSIARAAVQDARLGLAELEQWRDALPRPGELDASTAPQLGPLRVMADARLALAQRRLERAEADLALARARLELTYAETGMQYDLAVYDLAVLRASRDAARAGLEASSVAVDSALVELDGASDAFWAAYRSRTGGGAGADALLWLPTHRETGLLAH